MARTLFASEQPISKIFSNDCRKTSYFLGSIVLIKSEGAADAEVIDGQQRLTTLTMLLSAIREGIPRHNLGGYCVGLRHQ